MNELIKIEKSNVGGDLIETVNARELHSFLEVGKDFQLGLKTESSNMVLLMVLILCQWKPLPKMGEWGIGDLR